MDTRKIGLIIGGIAVVAVIAAAAFFGAQMLNEPEQAAASADSGGRVMEIISDDGSGPVAMRITFENSPDLPDRHADAAGVFVRREDNSYIIGTGNIMLDVEVDGNTGERDVALSSDGPEVEVLVTRDTQLYEDVTENPEPDAVPESGEITVVQQIEAVDSLEGLGGNLEIQVWGERRGDRIVADFLVYRIVDDF